jgi:hypothetical protein
MEPNNALTFTRRSIQSNGQIPAAREGGLAIAVEDNIYYVGGRAEGNISLNELCGAVIHVFNTQSDTWSKIESLPPRKCGEIYIYGTAIGKDIWIHDQGCWICFDTVKKAWNKVVLESNGSISFAQSLYLSAIGVIGNSMYYYDGNHNTFEKKVYQLDTVTHQNCSTTDQEGFGEHPQERHETYMFAISDDILVLYAPYASYERKKAIKYGELFYYDIKEGKWARVKELQNDPTINLYAYYFCGIIGTSLYFVPTRDSNPNEWWTLDLATNSWVKKIVTGDATKYAKYATIVGNKVYCWMSDGQMTVVDVGNMPSNDEQKRLNEQLAQMARAALSAIKASVAVIEEYVPEPIIVDTTLDAVNVGKPKVHSEMVTGFAGLFPQVNQEKIVESTVAAPSDSVLMHKNYLHYLTLAWSNHFSVVISPDIIFYTVLCEIADEILTSPDDFRHLFTDSAQKKGIMSLTHDVTKIDLNSLINGIAVNVPVDASIFTADFSCSTVESRLAIQSAFCEAMSAYYFYMSTLCGIPRVKVLGTKQDWEIVENKFHRMRTEVFNQDGTAEQTMSQYLKRAEEQIRKIYTTRDPEFWKEMFSINNCSSGHTDVVEGWINQFYRKGYAHKSDGKIHYSGDDFYNYKAHISTVKWQNVETQRHFELKSGLMYSNVVSGETELDTKFPWLEPQFCHVIAETDGSGKMTPEGFKSYIEGTLKGRDKMLMKQFYEVLKDDPIELVKGGSQEVNFRLELVIRQIEAWKQEFLKTGKSANVNLSSDACGLALGSYEKIGPQNQAQLGILKEKLVEYLKTDKNITGFHLHKKLVSFEADVLDVLIGRSDLEDLGVFLSTQEALESVSLLLLHPACKLKKFSVYRSTDYFDDDEDEKQELNYAVFAEALLKSNAPLEILVFDAVPNKEVANSVAELCRRLNGLKLLKMEPRSTLPVGEIVLRGQLESKTLQEIALPQFDKASAELTEFIVKNLPLNPSLETISRIWYPITHAQLAQALRIPSLKSLSASSLQDMSFLTVTTQLTNILAPLESTAEQLSTLQDFVTREDCPLETLFVEKSILQPGAGAALAKGLVQNKSIKTFNLRKSTFKDPEDAKAFVELIVEWLEKPYCKLEKVNLSEMANFGVIFEGQILQRLLRALKTNNTLKELLVSINCTAEDIPLVVELVSQNSTLARLQFGGKPNKFSDEERAPLVAAVKASTSLVMFTASFLSNSEQKYQSFSMEDLMD